MGTGYPAALLWVLAQRVYSVEWGPPLVERAADIPVELGYDNVEARAGDGYYGWAEHGPFDAVIVKRASITFRRCCSPSSGPAGGSLFPWGRRTTSRS